MIRAAAKNHDDVAVVVDPERLPERARRTAATWRRTTSRCASALAQKAYARTAAYDAAISNWFAARARRARRPPYRAFGGKLRRRRCATARTRTRRRLLPRRRSSARRRDRAAGAGQGALLQQHQRHRRGLRVRRGIRSGAPAACVIVKHANPCGVAEGATCVEAYRKALRLRSDLGVRRHRRAQPARSMPRPRAPSSRSSPKSSSRRTRPTRRSRSSARRRTCACCSPAACPIRARERPDGQIRRRRPAGADRATTRWSTTCS